MGLPLQTGQGVVEIRGEELFKLFKKAEAPPSKSWRRQWSPAGVVLTRGAAQTPGDVIDNPLLVGYLTQLEDDGLAVETDDGYLLGWDSLYMALGRSAYSGLRDLLTVIAVAATPDDERRSELGSGGKRSRNILAA